MSYRYTSAFGGQHSIQLSYGSTWGTVLRGHCDPAIANSVEKLVGQFQRVDQRVNLGAGVVHREGRTTSGRDAKMIHQRPGTVMARAHRHPLLVEDGRDVMRMRRPVHGKRENRRLVGRGALHAQPVEPRKTFLRVVTQIVLVTRD